MDAHKKNPAFTVKLRLKAAGKGRGQEPASVWRSQANGSTEARARQGLWSRQGGSHSWGVQRSPIPSAIPPLHPSSTPAPGRGDAPAGIPPREALLRLLFFLHLLLFISAAHWDPSFLPRFGSRYPLGDRSCPRVGTSRAWPQLLQQPGSAGRAGLLKAGN